MKLWFNKGEERGISKFSQDAALSGLPGGAYYVSRRKKEIEQFGGHVHRWVCVGGCALFVA